MLSMQDFGRLIAPIKNKLFSMVSWVLIKSSSKSEAEGVLKLTTYGVAKQAHELEHVQNYGFFSHPLPDSEGLAITPTGDQAQEVVISVQDRRYQPDVEAGEAVVYSHLNKEQPHRIVLKNDGSVEIFANSIKVGGGSSVEISANEIEIVGNSSTEISANEIKIIGNSSVELSANSIKVGGNSSVEISADSIKLGENSLKKLVNEDMIAKFNSHTHYTSWDGPPTAPIIPILPGEVVTEKTEAE